ncbi:MAG TPA: PAS domain S-box protein [Cyclobacteriaceae bacterium]|nr:PAS domain S-box protein [Cyclobacteriaceae bacterium]
MEIGRQAPDLISSIPNAIPGLIACIDCNMKVLYCNVLFRQRFPFGDGVSGLPLALVIGPELFNQLQKNMGHVLVGQPAKFEACINDTVHKTQYFDVSLCPQFDEKTRVKGFIFHATDTTEKIQAERGLTDYFENATICLHWVDENGYIIWANPAELKTLGYSKEEYIGRHISEFHASQPVINDMMFRLLHKQTLKNYDADLVCKDGSIKHVVINSSVRWEGEKFIHTRCFTVDITEQKLAIQAMKETEQRFSQMANLVPLVIWTTDDLFQCNYLSDRWVEATGSTLTAGLEEGWIELIHPDDREKIRRSWTDSTNNHKAFEAKFRLLNSGGKYTATYANCLPQIDTAGVFDGYIGIFQDISEEQEVKIALEQIVLERTKELRASNESLSQAKKALQQKNAELKTINTQLSSFAHIASHDLQEPLRKIQMLSSLLFTLEGGKFSTRGTELFNRITDSSTRMRTLIKDLLAYATSNVSRAKFDAVDVDQVVSDVWTQLDVRVAEKHATILRDQLPVIEGVKFQVHQLFLNLISNALKFSRPDTAPVIEVYNEVIAGTAIPGFRSRGPKNYNHIIVKDNGIGFEPDQTEKIFEMFRRLHGQDKYEGTGIGLAICKRIVENHDGTIVAESHGLGAIFHIYLPVLTPETKS